MFKKVKSLLIAGLLVLGSVVPVFADNVLTGVDYEATKTSINNRLESTLTTAGAEKTEEGGIPVYTFDTYSLSSMLTLMNTINDNDNDGIIMLHGEDGYNIYYDSDFDGDVNLETPDVELLAIIRVDEFIFENQKGLITLAPGTGDALAVGAVVGVVALGGVLVVVNKKRKEK